MSLTGERTFVGQGQCQGLSNYKALLDNPKHSGVIIATPEHWHHQMLLDALSAGKDVYIEKPLCRTPEAGRRADESARNSRSIVAGWHAAPQL